MKPLAKVVTGIVLGLLLTGCATLRAMSIPPGLGRLPTADEQRVIDSFAPRVIAAAQLEGYRCRETTFVTLDLPNDDLKTMARLNSPDPCNEVYIQVSTRYLHSETPAELGGTLAHELGHIRNGDWSPQRAAVPQIQREREADAFSLRVLNRLGPADCQARIEHWRKIREQNIREMGVEQKTTVGTQPQLYRTHQDLRGGVPYELIVATVADT